MGRSSKLPSFLLFLPLLLGAVLVLFPRSGTTGGTSAPGGGFSDSAAGLSAEELLFLLQYVGSDYAGAVEAGAVVNDFEYQEMLEFTRILLEEHARLDPSPASEVGSGLERLRTYVEQKEDPGKVLALTREIVQGMTRELRLVTYPTLAPNLENGKRLYEVGCAQCHGANGDGNGPSAPAQEPPPTSFRGPRMKSVAPHQLYNAIGFGVDGTAMPSYESAHTVAERWDLAFFVMTLRSDFSPEPPKAPVALAVRELATFSDEELLATREIPASTIDYFRGVVPETTEAELLRTAESSLAASYRAFENGDRDAAVRLSLEAYLEGIEPVEGALLAVDARLVRDLERSLAQYRAALREGSPSDVAARLDRARALTEEARTTLAAAGSGFGFAFLQSAAIILREGIEAALLLAILISYLAAAGLPELRRYVFGGTAVGLAAGFLTWLAAHVFVEASTLQREALEGITSLLAAAVLFSVSFWIIHNADLKKWRSYIEAKAKSALGAGSGLALATVAFLAVYREAFETVLFYQALWIRSGAGAGGGGIVTGFLAGVVALVAVVVLMFRYGKRIPLQPFFAVTGVLLALLSFVFAGYGIAELQKIGWVQETPLDWVPYVPFLDLQPTLEGLSLQIGIFLSFVLSWFVGGRVGKGRELTPARVA